MDRRIERFGWIEASIRLTGRFAVSEKKAYRHRFGLSDAMVSRDQDAFRQLFNERLGYPAISKIRGRLEISTDVKLPDTDFFPLPNLARWLEEALHGQFETVAPIRRMTPERDVLRSVILALQRYCTLRIEYLPRHGEAGVRIISPHTLVHVAGRLHLRAWDHERNEARDFVLTRIRAAVAHEKSDSSIRYVDRDNDRDWSTYVCLEISPKEGEKFSALQADYGLDNFGITKICVRRAYAYYFIEEDLFANAAGSRSPVRVRER